MKRHTNPSPEHATQKRPEHAPDLGQAAAALAAPSNVQRALDHRVLAQPKTLLGLQRSMGNQALNRMLTTQRQAQRDTTAQTTRPAPIQRQTASPARAGGVIHRMPFAGAYQQLTQAPQWHAEAEAYERRLGGYAANHGKAKGAANGALRHMEQVLGQYYDTYSQDEVRRKAFLKDDTSSAGQVGTQIGAQGLDDLFTQGNLREQMTAFYNAAYYKAGYGAPQDSFKQILHEITFSPSWKQGKALSDKLQLNTPELKKQHEFLNGWTRSIGESALKMVKKDKAYVFARDIFALGNLSYQSSANDLKELTESQMDRKDRSDEEKASGPHKKTPRDYLSMGAPLSQREHQFLSQQNATLDLQGYDLEPIDHSTVQFNAEGQPLTPKQEQELGHQFIAEYQYDQQVDSDKMERGALQAVYRMKPAKKTLDQRRASDLAPDQEGPELPLEWVEGTAWFNIDPQSSWYQRVRDKLGMPIVAGVSGTTARMLSAFKWLNVPGVDPLDFRLAILGWMLTSWDHSLYEIFRGSEIAGYTGGESTASPMDMYANVPPLSVEELRANVCKDRMFPHELVYKQLAEEKKPDQAKLTEPGQAAVRANGKMQGALQAEALAPNSNPDLAQQLADAGTTATDVLTNVNPAQSLALTGYSGKSGPLIDAVLRLPQARAIEAITAHLQQSLAWHGRTWRLEQYLFSDDPQTAQRAQERYKLLMLTPQQWFDGLGAEAQVRQQIANPQQSPQANQQAQAQLETQLAAIAAKLYPELQMHANMMSDGLHQLPALNNVTVWTKDVDGSVQTQKNKLVISKVVHASRNQMAALQGQRSGGLAPLLQLQLTGKAGKDIAFLSMAEDQHTVLIEAGATFTITEKVNNGHGTTGMIRATED